MKKIKNILSSAVVTMALGGSVLMTSCTDYLTLYPTNSVILENYWKTAEDVTGMLATCYKNMVDKETMKRMMIWGELRADNINTRTSASNDLKYIVEANLLETNGWFKWEKFYQTINYCNMLIKYAPGVLNEDPDFTQGDLDIVMGEAYALRALCHFYLVRSFRDIPLAYVAMDADEQEISYPQVEPLVALDSIMSDLRKAEPLVVKSGNFSRTQSSYNYGRITRNAVRAMMADVSMWQAAFTQYNENSDIASPEVLKYYDVAITNCDSIITDMNNRIIKEYEENNVSMTEIGPGTKNPYILIPNVSSTIGTGVAKSKSSNSYNQIFGNEESLESIFELELDGSKNVNSAVADLYGYSSNTGDFLVPSKAPIITSLYKETDLRLYSFTNAPTDGKANDKTEYLIAKYTSQRSPLYGNNDYYRGSTNNDANWIIYRKTDVMLMWAQALALRAASSEDLSKSFYLVKAVNDRSLYRESDSLSYSDYATAESLQELVLDERLRELTFEGKRWYDLVQKALRERSTKAVLDLIVKKLDSNAGAVQSKMASINSLFCPIYESELKLNSLLKQNPAFESNNSISKN